MLRNKRTVARADVRLAPLTERILQGMGPPGAAIRSRLLDFYRERVRQHPGETEGEARRGS